jgi:hypothetical protein
MTQQAQFEEEGGRLLSFFAFFAFLPTAAAAALFVDPQLFEQGVGHGDV